MATTRTSRDKKRKPWRQNDYDDDQGEGDAKLDDIYRDYDHDHQSHDDDGNGTNDDVPDTRRSKRLKLAQAAEARISRFGKSRKKGQIIKVGDQFESRKSQALQQVNPNQRRLSSSRSDAVKVKGKKIVPTTASSRQLSDDVPRRSSSNKINQRHQTKPTGDGTASDPLCLSSDDDDDDDVFEQDEVDCGRNKRRKSRCHWSSPIPQRRTQGEEDTVAAAIRESKLVAAVQAFRPPRRYSSVPRGVTNIDKITSNDPLQVVDYVDDMYDHYRQREEEESKTSSPTYLCPDRRPQCQPFINERMRAILVDWLIEVHYKFKLFESTLYLTVNLVDRYLEKKRTTRRDLQLVGVTALLIASKYEELYIPELRDLTYICDDAYTADEILTMENTILKTLDYRLSVPTARTFLQRFCMAATMSSASDAAGQDDDDSVDDEEREARSKLMNLSSRVLDGTLLSFKLLQREGGYKPSQLAAASILIARNSLLTTSALDCEEGCDGFSGNCQCDWTPTLQHYTRYSKQELVEVARAILDAKVALKRKQSQLVAVHKKYRHVKYGNVSNYSLLEETMFKDVYHI